MRIQLKRKAIFNDRKTFFNEPKSDDVDERDLKRFVRKILEYFHPFYNLFRNTSYCFSKRTEKQTNWRFFFPKKFSTNLHVDRRLRRFFDFQLNRFYSPLNNDVRDLNRPKNRRIFYRNSFRSTHFVDQLTKKFDQTKRFDVRYVVNKNKSFARWIITFANCSKISLTRGIPRHQHFHHSFSLLIWSMTERRPSHWLKVKRLIRWWSTYQICKLIFDCSTGMILLTKSTPKNVFLVVLSFCFNEKKNQLTDCRADIRSKIFSNDRTL